jgi:pSer/pThr/pTyr-binding forkhead associated (FHA) protein
MDEFLKACGATGPLDLRIENQGETTRWSSPQPFALIGSDPMADLLLEDPRVDPLHAYLQVIEGKVYWVDLGSQGGTHWEHNKTTARCGWLIPPHGIGIGPYLIQSAAENHQAADALPQLIVRPDPFASRPQDSDDLPRVVLEFRRDAAKPIRWRMRHILTLLGSSPFCKVRLAAPGVSPFHCSLLRTTAGVWMVNLGRDGVAVNGSRARAARLEDRDELQIGGVTIRVFFKPSLPANGKTPLPAGTMISPVALLTPSASLSRELATSRVNSVWRAPGQPGDNLHADRIANEGEIPASLLTLAFDQFEQMQQQFLDQFQQTAVMMFRALGTMHREQMDELRDKLDSLQELGDNFKALQAQMANNPPPSPSPPIPEPAPSPLPQPGTPPGTPGAPGTPAPDLGEARPSDPPAGNSTDPLREKLRSLVDDPNGQSMNVHEWMIGRLAALEAEQRTRWQKILDVVRGR